MIDDATEESFLAMTFAVRSDVYAFEQLGAATLLPWLQRFAGASAAPGLPPWCLGLLNVRGTVQMAIDLGNLLGFGPTDIGDSSRLIFIEQGRAQLGLLVDSEIGVRRLRPQHAAASAPAGPFAVRTGMLGAQPVTVLDGSAIIHYVAQQLEAPALDQ